MTVCMYRDIHTLQLYITNEEFNRHTHIHIKWLHLTDRINV